MKRATGEGLTGVSETGIAPESIDRRIFAVRGQRVMLDVHLARLYGVTTAGLNRAVGRNLERFPRDFSFVLPSKELKNLMCQIGTSSLHGGRRKPVRVFTEHGVAMLSSVLRSRRAIRVNIAIMRAFSRFRQGMARHEYLARRLHEMETTCDARFNKVLEIIRGLMIPPAETPKERIGFHPSRRHSGGRAHGSRPGRRAATSAR
jgi:hypothetical protein